MLQAHNPTILEAEIEQPIHEISSVIILIRKVAILLELFHSEIFELKSRFVGLVYVCLIGWSVGHNMIFFKLPTACLGQTHISFIYSLYQWI